MSSSWMSFWSPTTTTSPGRSRFSRVPRCMAAIKTRAGEDRELLRIADDPAIQGFEQDVELDRRFRKVRETHAVHVVAGNVLEPHHARKPAGVVHHRHGPHVLLAHHERQGLDGVLHVDGDRLLEVKVVHGRDQAVDLGRRGHAEPFEHKARFVVQLAGPRPA